MTREPRHIAQIAGELSNYGTVSRVLQGGEVRYHLVLDHGGELYRIRCKPTNFENKSDASVSFKLYMGVAEERIRNDDGPEPDFFAFWHDKVYLVPFNEPGKSTMSITLSGEHEISSANIGSANISAEYEADVQIAMLD